MNRQEQQAYGHIEQWRRSKAISLGQVYKSYSTRKARAWQYCENLRATLNGTDLKVISHNVPKFTAGFQFEHEGKQMFMYITASYDVAVPLE